MADRRPDSGFDRRKAMLWLGGAVTTLAGCGGSGSDGGGATPTPTPPPLLPSPPPPGGQANILVTGMSVWRGDDIVPVNYPDREAFMAANAPAQYFRRALLRYLAYPPELVAYDNQAVGGSFDNDVPAQYAASKQTPRKIVFLGLAMNSGSTYGVYGYGPNAGFTRDVLRAQLRRIKADGSVPIVANTVHPWPEKTTPEIIAGSLYYGLGWPEDRRTLFATEPLSFDAQAFTVTRRPDEFATAGLFDNASGGARIKAGSQLLIGGGANDGRVLVVTERISGTTLRVRPGDLLATESLYASIRHVSPPLEEIMETPPSRQRVERDWTGGGVAVDGLASYALWNAMLLELCREEDVALLDFEYRGFKWVERYGWNSVYEASYRGVTISNTNHPVLAAQRVIYGELLTSLGHSYALGQFVPGFQVLRGPTIA